ncbi:RNA polymerase sigma factor [Microbacterium phyllosphaerae]|uniref:RNA polymerase sigma factor n=1 Tax=Microbacterium phyllosphaerae TaxID=124798 RepID=UPI000EA1E1CE|nr:sigma-70 family RNA polymerase sigma factor [Microbacterium phyllosphaerae]
MSGTSAVMRWRFLDTLQIVFADAEPFPFTSLNASAPAAATGEPNKAVIFRTLFDDYWPRVRRHLACFLDNEDEIDEITAEVFVVAWRKLQPDKPMGLRWFIRTADNKLRDVDRRAHSRSRAMEALGRGLLNFEDRLHPLEALALQQAMKTLNARERQIVILTYWDELSAGEVADILRSSTAAVWTTLTRARAKLRAELEPKDGQP